MLGSLFEDTEIAAIFSDQRYVSHMLGVEAALAKVEARLGIIPAEAGVEIGEKIASFQPDIDLLKSGLADDGVPVIELVRQLREHVSMEAANYVHFGATTQDIMDTALVLQMREALEIIEGVLGKTIASLAGLADRHRNTLMAGRTHSQQAVPISFGFKVATWLAPLVRHRKRLQELRPRVLAVQFGGAAGTLEPLGEGGVQVAEALAAELGLSVPLMPWHTQRDTLAEVAGWLSMVSGSLGKMAQDIILMAQSEVGELRETSDGERGGSSTMPQKENPIVSEQIVACARMNANLLGAMHQALIQEHERATGGWQIEWLALPRMFGLTASALRKAIFLGANLVVDQARMRRNVEDSHGLMLAEAVTFALSEKLGRNKAKEVVTAACRTAVAADRNMVDIVREQTGVDLDWEALKDEARHLGSAQAFIDRVLQAADQVIPAARSFGPAGL